MLTRTRSARKPTKAKKPNSERGRDTTRRRRERAEGKDVTIPPCADRERRELLESDDCEWLRYYFDTLFTYDFTAQQRAMIEAIGNAITYGGDQAIAASRGEGKTKLAERVLLKHVLTGRINFAVLFAATGAAARDSLESLRAELETNDRLLADYPEVCWPVRCLENTPNRAHFQTVSGKRHDTGEAFSKVPSKFKWCGDELTFPAVPGSTAAKAIIATRGLESAVRGLNKGNRRPQVAIIDDPDTEETVRSEEQARKLEDRIDRGIAGLGGQKRGIARVMLTTLQRTECVSAWFTDPAKKPSFKGRRFRYLIQPPERTDLWDEYVQLRQANLQARDENGNQLDEHARGAHAFYLDHREAMDAGAIVANPNRFDPETLPDGSQVEVSALQRYYNEVARIGQEAVSAEYDNNPTEEETATDSGITASGIQLRLSGYPRFIVPPDCIKLTQGMDIQKAGAHWVVKAWRGDATNYVIDYGFTESHGTTHGSDVGIEHAVRKVILARMEQLKELPYKTADGRAVPVDMTLVDSGWHTTAVYAACAAAGLGIYPAKGHGKSHGCATPSFHDIHKHTPDRKPGDGWFQSAIGQGRWLVHCDTDRWKGFEHARWLTEPGKPGAAYLYGDMTPDERRFLGKRMPAQAKEHHSFARHLTAEIEVEEVVRGALKRSWKIKTGRTANHYLDASYLADVAANMVGVRLLGEQAIQPTIKYVSLGEMARRANGGTNDSLSIAG